MPPRPQPPKPINKDGTWYLVRRVPKEFAAIERRRTITWSTGIPAWQDPRAVEARRRVQELDARLQQHWRDTRDGKHAASEAYMKAVARAELLSTTYVPAADLATGTLDNLHKRFQQLIGSWGMDQLSSPTLTAAALPDAVALLGAAPPPSPPPAAEPPPSLMVSQMLDEYQRINASTLKLKSPQQLRAWTTRRRSALELFTDVIGGDKPFSDLTRRDAQAFRQYWQDRINNEELKVNSANRQIRQFSGLYSNIKTYMLIDGPGIFDKLRIPGGEDGHRIPFDPTFVQEHYLADGMFDGLNAEARRIIYLIIETGLRISEACALTSKTISLDGPVPYVDIQQFNRQTKTPESVRKVPLVGVSLLAMQAQPNGFPRYYDKPDALSALVSKAITTRNLRPGGKMQTLYSMRHTIIDRLKAAEAPKDIQEDMIGHKHMYGEGTSLEHRQQWLQRIAFKPPSTV